MADVRGGAEVPNVRFVPVDGDDERLQEIGIEEVDLEERAFSLGSFGRAVRVDGPERFDAGLLQTSFDVTELDGIDHRGARLFRFDGERFAPVWDSGVNPTDGIAWGRVRRPGIYVPIGLPRDRVVQGLLSGLARERKFLDEDDEGHRRLLEEALTPLLEEDEAFFELRRAVTLAEIQTGLGGPPPGVRLGGDGAPLPPPLPKGLAGGGLRERLGGILDRGGILPEEILFFPPEDWREPMPPWDVPYGGPGPGGGDLPGKGPVGWEPGDDICPPWLKFPPWPREPEWWDRFVPKLPRPWWWWRFPPFPICWLFARDWWMHQHDRQHTGAASGCSGIRRSTVGGLTLQRTVTLDGPIISQPAIVAGKVYVGTASSNTIPSGGTMYRIDLASGVVELTFQISGVGARQGQTGICCTPAVVGGRVYFSALNGKIYCLNASTFALEWATDLRHRDLAHNQPVDHGSAPSEGWSSPLVANGRVYVGFGEGESNAYGFVYCLDAATGNVVWLFCTNQFVTGTDNAPNVIPPATWTGPGNPPAPFSLAASAPTRGASPWGSAAYDAVLNRVYIGTGNALDPGDTPLPDSRYASGIVSLDATTGEFRGFFQPAPSDSYKPTDLDVDVPAPPIVFVRGGQRCVALGSKNGSFFILDADTLAVIARRQLLPYDVNGNPFPGIDPGAGENMYGSFCSAALHRSTGRLFVGVGGYSGAIDSTTTPFIRSLDWETLADRWPTSGNNPPMYSAAQPPLYTTPNESGLASPAVVNDVVFMSTSKVGLYALDVETGASLWSATGLPTGWGNYAWGPAVYGNYVLNGVSDGNLYVYHL